MSIKESFILQRDYKSHKKRLQSIKKSNPSDKINRITSQYFQLTNGHKKIREIDHSFQKREESSRRQHTRSLMTKTISEYSKKVKQKYQSKNTLLPMNHYTSRLSFKGDFFDKIQNQNARVKSRIDGIHSVYNKIRRNSDINISSLQVQKKKKNKNKNRYRIMELLKNQLQLPNTQNNLKIGSNQGKTDFKNQAEHENKKFVLKKGQQMAKVVNKQ